MSKRRELDNLLKIESEYTDNYILQEALAYARTFTKVENVVAVVSDMAKGESHILTGGFASVLGLENYSTESSIWEKRILDMMTPQEQEEKFIAELRFFHYLRHLPKNRRPERFLLSKLRFKEASGKNVDVLHRMYYIYDHENDTVLYAICLYGPLVFNFKGKSHVVNTMTGEHEELTSSSNCSVLGQRERQVLSLIDSGLKSAEIADRLNISIHTVSRHRQEILAKLQVKNSIEACRLARSMELI